MLRSLVDPPGVSIPLSEVAAAVVSFFSALLIFIPFFPFVGRLLGGAVSSKVSRVTLMIKIGN
jgi:hypothetical protein